MEFGDESRSADMSSGTSPASAVAQTHVTSFQKEPEGHGSGGRATTSSRPTAGLAPGNIATGAVLRGVLATNNEDVHFSMVPLSLEDQLRIGTDINKPYRALL
jgi:hypothetical protein